jgi:hypothetical protein
MGRRGLEAAAIHSQVLSCAGTLTLVTHVSAGIDEYWRRRHIYVMTSQQKNMFLKLKVRIRVLKLQTKDKLSS